MAQCTYTKIINDSPIACGKCHNCRKNRTSGWSFRLQKEDAASAASFFVTLTYNTDHVPLTKKGLMSLQPTDITNFMKRLRKELNGKIKYYVAGEYGSKRNRPHYHVIFFTYNYQDAFILPEKIEKTWKLGDIHVGTTTPESIVYTLKYIRKASNVPFFYGDDRVKEFQRTSKGLGAKYLSEAIKKYHLDKLEDRCYATINGHKHPLPRYYKDKIYTKVEKLKIGEHMEKTIGLRNFEQLKNARTYNERKQKEL